MKSSPILNKNMIRGFCLVMSIFFCNACATVSVNKLDKMELRGINKVSINENKSFSSYKIEDSAVTSHDNTLSIDREGNVYFYYMSFGKYHHEIKMEFAKKDVDLSQIHEDHISQHKRNQQELTVLQFSSEPMRLISIRPSFYFTMNYNYDHHYQGMPLHKIDVEIVHSEKLSDIISVLSLSDRNVVLADLANNKKQIFLSYIMNNDNADELKAFLTETYILKTQLSKIYLSKYPNDKDISKIMPDIINKLTKEDLAELASVNSSSYIRELLAEAKSKDERAAFERAKLKNAVERYDWFLKEYPNSTYISEIKQSRETAFFEEVRQKNSYQDYDKYLKEYPNGMYAVEANKLREKPFFDNAKSTNTVSGYDSYIKEYPNGTYIAEAQKLKQSCEEDEKRRAASPRDCVGIGCWVNSIAKSFGKLDKALGIKSSSS